MSELLHITEYVDVNLDTERWSCHDCGQDFGSARGNYKRGLLVAESGSPATLVKSRMTKCAPARTKKACRAA